MWYNKKYIGDSPSGKAVGSGPTIRGFESLIPSQMEFSLNPPLNYMVDLSLLSNLFISIPQLLMHFFNFLRYTI